MLPVSARATMPRRLPPSTTNAAPCRVTESASTCAARPALTSSARTTAGATIPCNCAAISLRASASTCSKSPCTWTGTNPTALARRTSGIACTSWHLVLAAAAIFEASAAARSDSGEPSTPATIGFWNMVKLPWLGASWQCGAEEVKSC